MNAKSSIGRMHGILKQKIIVNKKARDIVGMTNATRRDSRNQFCMLSSIHEEL